MAKSFRSGQVKIANEILDQLAVRASSEVYGVHSDEDSKINLQNAGPKAVVTDVDGKLIIDLVVNLDKNVNVRKTIKDIQENVIRVIEAMTGLSVARVNVTVPRLDF